MVVCWRGGGGCSEGCGREMAVLVIVVVVERWR